MAKIKEPEHDKDVEILAVWLRDGAEILFPGTGGRMLRDMVRAGANLAHKMYGDVTDEDGSQAHEVCVQSIIARLGAKLDMLTQRDKQEA